MINGPRRRCPLRSRSVPLPIDLNLVCAQSRLALVHALGYDITLKVEVTSARCPVLAARSDVEQLLLDLAMSAKHAMPGGGTLTIRVSSVVEVPPGLRHPYVRAHSYTRLTFSDNSRTTERDLAGVARVVHALGGTLRVESDDSSGTHVTVDLPCVDPAIGRRLEV